MIRAAASAIMILLASAAHAFEPVLPLGARVTASVAVPLDAVRLPLGVLTDGDVPMQEVEGAVSRKAWRMGGTDLTVLQIMAPLRRQLEAEGFEIVFECADVVCGGFDFRFAIDVLPGPNMYVNIRSYRFLTALRGPVSDPQESVTILVSTAASAAYVQVTHVAAASDQIPATQVPVTRSSVSEQDPSGTTDLLETGRIVLEDMTFGTGNSQLGPGPFASLGAVAEFLRAAPEVRVAIVGHTDTVGGLDANIALSRERAQSVRTRLIATYGVDAARLDAEGMGYLAPIASNRSAEGRRVNRRVEVILLN